MAHQGSPIPPDVCLCHTDLDARMTMLSFLVGDEEAALAQDWAERLGIERSQLVRDALRRDLVRLSGEQC
jgi:hypothetical protein